MTIYTKKYELVKWCELDQKSIKKAEVVAYEELGAEALRRLEVTDFPVTVVNDAYGGDLYQEGKAKYRRD